MQRFANPLADLSQHFQSSARTFSQDNHGLLWAFGDFRGQTRILRSDGVGKKKCWSLPQKKNATGKQTKKKKVWTRIEREEESALSIRAHTNLTVEWALMSLLAQPRRPW